MRLLLHCCCGPCATVAADHFRTRGEEVTGWFYNPNIHPPQERLRREATMAAAAEAMRLPMLPAGPGMGLSEFLLPLARESGSRCRGCYGLRLEATAREAAGRGFDGFSTTLVMSPYQDLEAIARLGEQVGSRLGLEFRFADLRGRYVESCERSRELELYRQDYCGCVFSSLERAERRARRALAKALGCAAAHGAS